MPVTKPDKRNITANWRKMNLMPGVGVLLANGLVPEDVPPLVALRAAEEVLAMSVQGALTGKGAHLLIIDDPIKNSLEAGSVHKRDALWDWFHSTRVTRLEPGGAVIVNMTRWHDDDLVGRLLSGKSAGSLAGAFLPGNL